MCDTSLFRMWFLVSDAGVYMNAESGVKCFVGFASGRLVGLHELSGIISALSKCSIVPFFVNVESQTP